MSEKFIPNSFQVPNALVDEFLLSLNEYELKCYLFIIRKTKGWNKERDSIAISQFLDIFGVKDARTIKKALRGLLKKDLIVKLERAGRPSQFSINLSPNPLHDDEGGHVDVPPTSTCNNPLHGDVPRPLHGDAPHKVKLFKKQNIKNTLSSKKEETRECFKTFKERIKRDFAGKVICNCIPGYRDGIELRLTGAELLQIHGHVLDKAKAAEIWDWLATNKHMVGYMLPASTVQRSELKLEFAGRTVLVPILGKPTYAVAKDFEPAPQEGLFTLTLEFEHNGKPSLGSTAPKSADEWVQWFAQQQHNSFECPTYTVPTQITAGAKKIKTA